MGWPGAKERAVARAQCSVSGLGCTDTQFGVLKALLHLGSQVQTELASTTTSAS
jgi:hypothetical protein